MDEVCRAFSRRRKKKKKRERKKNLNSTIARVDAGNGDRTGGPPRVAKGGLARSGSRGAGVGGVLGRDVTNKIFLKMAIVKGSAITLNGHFFLVSTVRLPGLAREKRFHEQDVNGRNKSCMVRTSLSYFSRSWFGRVGLGVGRGGRGASGGSGGGGGVKARRASVCGRKTSGVLRTAGCVARARL